MMIVDDAAAAAGDDVPLDVTSRRVVGAPDVILPIVASAGWLAGVGGWLVMSRSSSHGATSSLTAVVSVDDREQHFL